MNVFRLLINSLPVTNYAYLNLLHKNSHICKLQKKCKVCKKDVLKCIHQYFVPNICNFTLNTWIDMREGADAVDFRTQDYLLHNIRRSNFVA